MTYMEKYVRIVFTVILFSIFFWIWPLRLFTNKNNCYFWTLERLIIEGGKAKWYNSKRHFGYHVIWIDKEGNGWEYTISSMPRRMHFLQMIFYNGTIRKFKHENKSGLLFGSFIGLNRIYK